MSDSKRARPWPIDEAAGAAASDAQLSEGLRLVSLLQGEPGVWNGSVWRAQFHGASGLQGQPPGSRPVAVQFGKAPAGAGASEELREFSEQARLCTQLADPRFVSIVECGMAPWGLAYQARELLVNPSLQHVLHSGGSLALEKAEAIAWQTTEAVAKLHAQGRAHGGLRPANIFPATQGAPALKLAAPGADTAVGPNANIGAAGSYESPERLLRGQAYAPADDLWALSVTLYEALTTLLPFEAPTAAAVAVAICNGEFSPPSRYRAELPISIDLWFARALHKNPQARFGDATELYQSFSQACNGQLPSGDLQRLDEDADDEKTAQWSLPDEWSGDAPGRTAPSQAQHTAVSSPALSPLHRSPSGAPRRAALGSPALGTLRSAPVGARLPPPAAPARLPPPQQAQSASPVGQPAVHLSSPTAATAPPSQRSSSISYLAGGLGLVLLLALGAVQLLPSERKTAATAPLPVVPPQRTESALRAAEPAELADGHLPTINAAEFVAGADLKAQEEASQPKPRSTKARTTKTRTAKTKAVASRRTSRAAAPRNKPSSPAVVARKKRRTKRRKRSATQADCVTIDAQGIRRIKPSCL